MEKYGVIMAGGGGTRFWPLSRRQVPKQLLKLDGEEYMINRAIDRLDGCVNSENILVVTNMAQAEKMRDVTKGKIKNENILIEPCARNTAACIGYAAVEILKKHGDGIMVITPSDAYIKEKEKFQEILKCAIRVAETEEKLVTIGIEPTFPATGYGYIRFDRESDSVIKRVLEFKEKPDLKTAIEFCDSEEYVWNSGMFIWKASVILKCFEKLLPELYKKLQKIAESMNTSLEKEVIGKVYPEMQSISIDYGIMERTSDVVVLPGTFGWSDVGSWDMLGSMYPEDKSQNVHVGELLAIDSSGCISYSKKKLTAILGIDNIIIIDTDDAIMVCSKERAQDIKSIVDELDKQGRTELL